jgi:hypothetical protein
MACIRGLSYEVDVMTVLSQGCGVYSAFEQRIARIVRGVSTWCDRYRVAILLCVGILLGWKGLLVALSGKYGDFQPLVNVVQRLHSNQPLYVTGVTYPEYVYSPFVALLIYPAGFLSPVQFRMVWLALNTVAIAGLLGISLRFLGVGTKDRSHICRVLVLTFLVAWPWIVGNLFNGQINPILMFLAMSGVWYGTRDRQLLGGTLLGAAMHIKPFPLVFLIPLAFQRRFRACFACLVSYALLIALPYLYFRGDYMMVLQRWFEANREQQSIYDVADWGHQSLSSLVFRSFGVSSPAPFSLDFSDPMYATSVGLTTLVVAISVWMMWRYRANVVFGISMAAILWPLTPPTSWKHYYLMLLLPLVYLARQAVGGGASAQSAGRLLGMGAILGVLRFISVSGDHHFFYSLSYCVWFGLAVWLYIMAHPKDLDSDAFGEDGGHILGDMVQRTTCP